MKYHLVTLGCQMNKSDSERVRKVIDEMGFVYTEKEEEASLLGVLACSVRQKSIDKAYARIYKWNKRKDRQNLITFISGCVLPADREKFLTLFDIIFTMDELPQFPSMIGQYGVVTPYSVMTSSGRPPAPVVAEAKREEPSFLIDFTVLTQGRRLTARDIHLSDQDPAPDINSFWDISPSYSSGFEAFIPIQNGCDKFCTFCAVPYTRGREVSRSSEEILDEVRNLVERGYKSITLLGQNVNSYGLDKGGKEISFAGLLEKIGEYGEDCGHEFWVYFTSPHPRDMNFEVIDTIARYKCLARQIHLPLQSGDDKVLIRMNRKHSLDKYRSVVEYIRKTLPDATLFTDIIVGFTSESEEQFMNTYRAMEEFAFNMAYVAVYSPRPGATSSRWEDDVPVSVKKERLHRLTETFAGSSLRWNQQMIGKTVRILVTGKEKRSGYLTGHTEGRIVTRLLSEDTSLTGKFVDARILSAGDFSIAGEILHVFESKAMV